jgi:hypothetical protein
MPSSALNNFTSMIGHVDQLVTIHAKLQQGPGRRHEQDAIHRAGVVMIVAAWEAYVEQVLLEALEVIEQDAGIGPAGTSSAGVPRWVPHAFGLRKTELANLVKRFNTPNAKNVRDLLLEGLSFNPWRHWSWSAPRRQWGEQEMRAEVDGWLDVRHSVAHGAALPVDFATIMDRNGRARLTLPLLKQCKAFFAHTVAQTDAALGAFLRSDHGVSTSW